MFPFERCTLKCFINITRIPITYPFDMSGIGRIFCSAINFQSNGLWICYKLQAHTPVCIFTRGKSVKIVTAVIWKQRKTRVQSGAQSSKLDWMDAESHPSVGNIVCIYPSGWITTKQHSVQQAARLQSNANAFKQIVNCASEWVSVMRVIFRKSVDYGQIPQKMLSAEYLCRERFNSISICRCSLALMSGRGIRGRIICDIIWTSYRFGKHTFDVRRVRSAVSSKKSKPVEKISKEWGWMEGRVRKIVYDKGVAEKWWGVGGEEGVYQVGQVERCREFNPNSEVRKAKLRKQETCEI